MADNIFNDLIDSFFSDDALHSFDEILDWIKNENTKISTNLIRTVIKQNTFWFYDKNKSLIRNRNNSFFTINGIKQGKKEQPIIVQNEVGYLGIIAKKINGVLHFLMQAKIEPGNVNKVQISPTLQATKSNFTRKHGGKAPCYLEYFENNNSFQVIYDGNEPEQCSRFYKKYNRNVIIKIPDNEQIPIYGNFKWVSIAQIKKLATSYDNLVNMDTRTVLSCIPFDLADDNSFKAPLLKSIFGEDSSDECINLIRKKQINSSKAKLIRLEELKNWSITNKGIFCKGYFPFHFEYFDIYIDEREVTHWSQPLAVANGKALFALAYIIQNNIMFFLIKIHSEIGCEFGSCFGPTIQLEAPVSFAKPNNVIEKIIFESIIGKSCLVDTILSEEGGRFYHEENRNIICELNISFDQIQSEFGNEYMLVTYKTIRKLIEKTHMVNIQLRNLLALLVDDYEKN